MNGQMADGWKMDAMVIGWVGNKNIYIVGLL